MNTIHSVYPILIHPIQIVTETIRFMQAIISKLAISALNLLAIGYSFCDCWLKMRTIRNEIAVQPSSHEISSSHAQQLILSSNSSHPSLEQPTLPPPEALFIPEDVLVEITKRSDFSPSLREVSKDFSAAYERAVNHSLFESYQTSPLLADRLQRIEYNHLSASPQEKTGMLYQDLLEDIDKMEGGEVIKKETLATYGMLSAKRLERLESWLDAINLIKLFAAIATQIPAAKNLLQDIRTKDADSQAQDIRAWMQAHQTELATLTSLRLSQKGLTKLPKEIGLLTQLEYLYLFKRSLYSQHPPRDDNRLKALPKEIGQLTRLHTLWLDNNQLTFLPKEMGQLTHLENLDLRGNKFKTPPKEISHLRIQHLRL